MQGLASSPSGKDESDCVHLRKTVSREKGYWACWFIYLPAMQSASKLPRPRLKLTDQAQCISDVISDDICKYVSLSRPSWAFPNFDGSATIFLRAANGKLWYNERSLKERMTRMRALKLEEARTGQYTFLTRSCTMSCATTCAPKDPVAPVTTYVAH